MKAKLFTDGGSRGNPGPAAYVSMDVLPGGDLGLFFEKDEYTRNVFTRVPMAWLTAQ
mgnify:CR=1 FL=1